MFGGNQQSGGGLFGAPKPAAGGFGGGGFGSQPAQSAPAFGSTNSFGGGGFGAQSTPAFGSGGFGAPAQSSSAGLFGASTFGAKPNAGGGFGAPATGSIFGSGNTGGSLFGNSSGSTFGTTSFGASTGASLFGGGGSTFGSTPAFGGTFGSSSGLGAPSSMFGAPSNTFGAHQVQQQQSQQPQPTVGSDPFGDGALFAHVSEALKREAEEEKPVALRNSNIPDFRLRTGTNRPPIQRPPGALAAARRALGADLFNTPLGGPNTTAFHVGSAHPRFAESGRRNRTQMYQWRTPEQLLRSRNLKRLVIAPPPKQSEDPNSTPVAACRGRFAKGTPVQPPIEHEEEITPANKDSLERPRRSEERARRKARELGTATPRPPFTTQDDITTRPSLDALRAMSAAELKRVKDFTVIREGVGEVTWDGETDVTALNIDTTVQLKYREIQVYPTEEDVPPPGVGLNKRATVRLHGIWKKDKKTGTFLKDTKASEIMVAKLQAHSKKEGLKFVDYKVDSGTWTFVAERF